MSLVVNTPALVCRSSRQSFSGSSSTFALAAPRVRVSADSVSLRGAPHRQSLQVVAQAKGKGKGKKKSAPAPKTGFGAAKQVVEKKEPAELDLKGVESYVMFNLCVRASADARWIDLGKMIVEDPSTIGAAMKERRASLRNAADSLPELRLVTKGKMDGVQYGAQEITVKTEEDEEVEEKPSVEVPLSGKIEQEVAALYTLNTGLAPPPGSIWSRNQELYGGNQKMPSIDVAGAKAKKTAEAAASAEGSE
mmetsp:Transcript_2261/g.4535  ORF Transcript_2261/g.4535 Transcript_2261/m.4535 type:complete len:250 (-) Transcript_2261:289-1038(-)|eukprot:CAMPEP_0118922670 /NCGR_PEP_ID=MMETSP1169-20130426/1526_1 /TAXON_ID=36882 /ORGANISM="Pyramimonas obovata, Strain CCMP722" /LENGTH=249 /DNA_ID=CAMNT_0006863585 /DNA_START=86 /DNA_END=835 /DNA_ORIENTATION=+